MCAVCQIYNWGNTIPFDKWNANSYNQYVKCIDMLKVLDELLGETNCEDLNKSKFMEELRKRLE